MAERGRGRVQNLAMAMADRRLWPDGSIIGLAMAERCGRGLATPGLPGVAMAAAPPNHMARRRAMAERGRGRVQNLAMAMADRRLWPDGSIIGLAMAERCGRGL